jgi:hypothetical protein
VSNLTFGPPVSLDGPLPLAPPHSLLNTEGVLKPAGDERWLNGVTIYSYPDELPLTWDPCSAGTYRDKAEGDGVPLPVFASVVVYLPITCSAMSIGDPEEFANRAEIALNAVESYAVEQQLSQGTGIGTNPFFADAAVDVLAAGAAVTPAVGLSYLEDAIGQTGKQGMIHATPAVISQWFEPSQGEMGPLVTANGTRVVSGGGYAGATPSGEEAAAAGQAWAYASGPVEVRHSSVAMLEISDVLDRATNDVTFRAERYVLAEWDTALQAAVLIDWTP